MYNKPKRGDTHESKAEYYAGINWTIKAKLAEGNEVLAFYAKAATSFTLSQAHSLQVYNSWIPFANRTESLGIEPNKVSASENKHSNEDRDGT